MLNRKFASIRASTHSKTDIRNSLAQSSSQRMSQSQSMDMQTNNQRTPNKSINNNLVNLSREPSSRFMGSHDRRLDFDSSPLATPVRSPLMKSTPQHPYVNLLHQPQQLYNNIPPYQLQYQNNASMGNQATQEAWNLQNATPPITHYTAAQIYMRPKVLNAYNQQGSSPQLSVTKKPPPPDPPKRLSSTISTGSLSSLKKSNGLSRSSK